MSRKTAQERYLQRKTSNDFGIVTANKIKRIDLELAQNYFYAVIAPLVNKYFNFDQKTKHDIELKNNKTFFSVTIKFYW